MLMERSMFLFAIISPMRKGGHICHVGYFREWTWKSEIPTEVEVVIYIDK